MACISGEVQRALAHGAGGFPRRVDLPPGYGRRMPERVVELPLARWTYRPGARVLDLGHANAMPCHLDLVASLPGPRRLVGLDVSAPGYDAEAYYRHSVRGDATRLPFGNGVFDLVWCISALEHFGMDNSSYGDHAAPDASADLRALGEILRVVDNDGAALITVPYGRPEDHGWFRQYGRDRWQRLLEIGRAHARVSEHYLQHRRRAGWAAVTPETLDEIGYADERNSGAAAIAVVYLDKAGATR